MFPGLRRMNGNRWEWDDNVTVVVGVIEMVSSMVSDDKLLKTHWLPRGHLAQLKLFWVLKMWQMSASEPWHTWLLVGEWGHGQSANIPSWRRTHTATTLMMQPESSAISKWNYTKLTSRINLTGLNSIRSHYDCNHQDHNIVSEMSDIKASRSRVNFLFTSNKRATEKIEKRREIERLKLILRVERMCTTSLPVNKTWEIGLLPSFHF